MGTSPHLSSVQTPPSSHPRASGLHSASRSESLHPPEHRINQLAPTAQAYTPPQHPVMPCIPPPLPHPPPYPQGKQSPQRLPFRVPPSPPKHRVDRLTPTARTHTSSHHPVMHPITPCILPPPSLSPHLHTLRVSGLHSASRSECPPPPNALHQPTHPHRSGPPLRPFLKCIHLKWMRRTTPRNPPPSH